MTATDPSAAPAAASRRRWRRADAPTVALHWMVAALLFVSLATGFRVASDPLDAAWSRTVAAAIGLQGEVLFWHVASACALLAAVSAYAVYLRGARQIARVRIDTSRLRDLRSPDRRRRWRSANVLIYWLAYALLAIAACTGLLMFSDVVNRALWGVTTIHRLVAWGLVGYVVLHVTAQLAMSGWSALYAITVPRMAYGRAAVAAGVTAALAAVGLYALDALTVRNLEMGDVSDAPRVDGDFGDPAWLTARPVTIQTAGGANLIDGGTAVTVRAVTDGADAYFLFEWQDPTRSLKHVPLQKTAKGWRMVQNGYAIADETDHYEDKFSVMLSDASRFAALRSIHLGPRPVDGLPGASGKRGLHFTDDGSVLDVWHWQAVRTDPMGLAEDDYFGAPRPPQPDAPLARYSAGYAPDPAVTGSSMENWKDLLEGPNSRRFDGSVVPRFLPKDPAEFARRLGTVNLDPASSQDAAWWLPAELAQPYTDELDASLPEGTVVPSVIIRRPITGDRGDVSAIGRWRDGIWRLEMKRALDTHSPYDVAVADGTYLWVAVFDHAQTRHSWHMRPLRLRIR